MNDLAQMLRQGLPPPQHLQQPQGVAPAVPMPGGVGLAQLLRAMPQQPMPAPVAAGVAQGPAEVEETPHGLRDVATGRWASSGYPS